MKEKLPLNYKKTEVILLKSATKDSKNYLSVVQNLKMALKKANI